MLPSAKKKNKLHALISCTKHLICLKNITGNMRFGSFSPSSEHILVFASFSPSSEHILISKAYTVFG
jgi:hypothetical protein